MKEITVKLSPRNTKLGNIPNISLVPGKDCANCSGCIKDCYALKAYRMYPDTKRAWEHNSKAFREDPYAAIDNVRKQLRKKRQAPKLFRIHVAGDFLNQDHVESWMLLAEQFQGTRFLAFTKRYDLDYSIMPENVQIVMSTWPGMELPQGDNANRPKVWLEEDTRKPDDAVLCSGTCDSCGMCWSLNEIKKDVYFPKH